MAEVGKRRSRHPVRNVVSRKVLSKMCAGREWTESVSCSQCSQRACATEIKNRAIRSILGSGENSTQYCTWVGAFAAPCCLHPVSGACPRSSLWEPHQSAHLSFFVSCLSTFTSLPVSQECRVPSRIAEPGVQRMVLLFSDYWRVYTILRRRTVCQQCLGTLRGVVMLKDNDGVWSLCVGGRGQNALGFCTFVWWLELGGV